MIGGLDLEKEDFNQKKEDQAADQGEEDPNQGIEGLEKKYKANYRKRGKIRWAKLSHFSRAPRKFSHEFLYKLRIMALFKCCKNKAPQKFSHKNYIRWNLQNFSPANLAPFTVI